jgi:hypothetical protein
MRLFGILRRRRHEPHAAPPPRSDSELHRRRAEAEAEVEDRDVDEMLDGIAERRRRTGRRDVGEEMADELRRGTWE